MKQPRCFQSADRWTSQSMLTRCVSWRRATRPRSSSAHFRVARSSVDLVRRQNRPAIRSSGREMVVAVCCAFRYEKRAVHKPKPAMDVAGGVALAQPEYFAPGGVETIG